MWKPKTSRKMTRRLSIIFSMFLLVQMTACVQESALTLEVKVPALEQKAVNSSEGALPGSLILLLDEGADPSALARACAETGATIERLFPYSGSQRERQFRMDRWYVLSFSEYMPVQNVAERFAGLAEVTALQYDTETKRSFGSDATEWTPVTRSQPVYESAPLFNDPKLIDQWHYINKADLSVAPTSRLGADINVRDAWNLTAGDPAIIVAICDEGVKYDHPDLVPNMWVNEAEKNGEEGVDDDGNGYIDDVHGYNFLSTYDPETGEGKVLPVSWDANGDKGHGTHVAGTVAATNNNGIGVCGVAGGNSPEGNGVRIMTCQVFSGNAAGGTVSRARAYRYAADMGASILQCSFGQNGGYLTSDKEFANMFSAEIDALEYFITNPAPGNPAGGNFAIFASGNEGYAMSGYPAAYNRYISVAAFGPDFLPTSYTNYGPGTNICAPGGDYNINSSSSSPERAQILSTLPKEVGTGEYGYMQGTSMACPHVSGVVALGLSYARKIGKTFTYDEFLALIYSSVNNIDYYIETCSKKNNGIDMDLTPYWQNMGSGAIDAWRLLMQIEGTPCLPVQKGVECKITLDQYFGQAASNLTYTSVKVSDEARATLGITGDPYVKYGKLYIRCENLASAKISISAIAGGSEMAGYEGAQIGGTEFTREVSILSRDAAVSENGGWL